MLPPVVRRAARAAIILCFLLVPTAAESQEPDPPSDPSFQVSVVDLQTALLQLPPTENVLIQRTFAPPEPRPRRPESLMPLYASLIALQGLDIHSTRRAIDSGAGREANPALRGVVNNSAAFIAVKAGATAGVIWASEKMWKKNRRAAVIFAAVVNVAMAAVVANNYRQSPK